jgi:hypothetical protein
MASFPGSKLPNTGFRSARNYSKSLANDQKLTDIRKNEKINIDRAISLRK